MIRRIHHVIDIRTEVGVAEVPAGLPQPVVISAVTLGSALGIWLGGAAIDAGLGAASVNWIGGIISGTGLLFELSSLWLDRIIAAQSFEEQPVAIAHHH